MLGKLWRRDSVLSTSSWLSLILAIVLLFSSAGQVFAAPVKPVSDIPLKAESADFRWYTQVGIDVATTRDELIAQYIEKIASVPDDQSTFTISLACHKDIYDWVVNKAINYHSLPTKDNPVIQDSYHIFKIIPKPYYARDNVRRFDLLMSVGKDINDTSLRAESIRATKEMAIAAQSVAANIEGLSDWAKLNYIDDWIAYHFNYDNSLKKFTAAEGFKTGEFVCSGYTEIFKLIADYAGLENKVEVVCGQVNISGAKGFHSWIIYTGDNGARYLIDPTYNDYYRTQKSCKKWFMLEESSARGYAQTKILKPVQTIFEQ